MPNIGVLIETGEDGVKEANFGVITAARGDGDNKLYAFVLDAPAEAHKSVMQAYGVQKIVELSAESGELASNPGLQAEALGAALNHFDITALLGLSSAKGRDLLARLAASLDAPLVQDCVGIDLSAKTVTKSHFSGKTLATIRINSNPYFCGLRPNVVEAQTAPCETEVIRYQAPVNDSDCSSPPGRRCTARASSGRCGRGTSGRIASTSWRCSSRRATVCSHGTRSTCWRWRAGWSAGGASGT